MPGVLPLEFRHRYEEAIAIRAFTRRSCGVAFSSLSTIGTIALNKIEALGIARRECLDHVIVFGERHLHDVLRSYAQCYNGARTHLLLAKDAPLSRAVQGVGNFLPLPIFGGLHHYYVWI